MTIDILIIKFLSCLQAIRIFWTNLYSNTSKR